MKIHCHLLSIIFFGLFTGATAQLPFKYDSLYQTIYAREFCRLVQQEPDLVLIDVRSAGEFADTSVHASLNIGHLKGAINIEIAGMKQNLDTLSPYKDKTIVFYCSHSQRSRRVSKYLSENGFTDFYNLNGGMSVLNQLSEKEFPCKQDFLITNLSFKNLSFDETVDLIRKEKQLVILDVRPASQFNSIDGDASYNVGRIKGAINIPYAELPQRMGELEQIKTQPILVYSSSGDGDGSRAAADLNSSGFVTVYHLVGGINDFIATGDRKAIIENPAPYVLVDAYQALQLLEKAKDLVIYDTRPTEEYNNMVTGKNDYLNLGHIRNAIHVEESAFATRQWPVDKKDPILIYGNEAAFKLASLLAGNGYKNVYLHDGLYGFVWSGFNIENCKAAKEYLVDHKGLY